MRINAVKIQKPHNSYESENTQDWINKLKLENNIATTPWWSSPFEPTTPLMLSTFQAAFVRKWLDWNAFGTRYERRVASLLIYSSGLAQGLRAVHQQQHFLNGICFTALLQLTRSLWSIKQSKAFVIFQFLFLLLLAWRQRRVHGQAILAPIVWACLDDAGGNFWSSSSVPQ